MKTKRKVVQLGIVRDADLRQTIERLPLGASHRRKMSDDVHLLEAAVQADSIVVSCDDEVRALFQQSTTAIPEIGLVVWVNPESGTDLLRWLEAGAPTAPCLTLGGG